MKNVFILSTFDLDYKYPSHIAICLQNLVHLQIRLNEIAMYDSLNHALMLCCHAYF